MGFYPESQEETIGSFRALRDMSCCNSVQRDAFIGSSWYILLNRMGC
jgi:hypothetical protein